MKYTKILLICKFSPAKSLNVTFRLFFMKTFPKAENNSQADLSIMKNVERRWEAHDKNPAKGFLFGSSNGCLSS